MPTSKHTYLFLAVVLLPALAWLAVSLDGLGSQRLQATELPQVAQGQTDGRGSTALVSREQRTFNLLTVAPSLTRTEISAVMEQSDHMRDVAEEIGEEDLGQALRRRVNEVEISEDEARAYFAQESDLFGGRSFEESRWTINQLLAIRKTREEFGI